MQICSGMSIARSFRLCRYAMFSAPGTRMWNPACSVRLYLPRNSTTYALCCGTTINVRRKTKITRIAAATATINMPWLIRCSDAATALVETNVQREPVDRLDSGFLAGRDCLCADVERSPPGAAVFDSHRLARCELLGYSDALIHVGGDRNEPAPQRRVDPLAQRHYRDDREHREQYPLDPRRQMDTDHADEPD